MYGENRMDDLRRLSRAFATNQLARAAPAFYFRGRTGRGTNEESASDIADYFHACFLDYFQVLGIAQDCISAFLEGKQVLEYGPGDIPAVALLMYAHGAKRVICVDRFPLVSLSDTNRKVLRKITNRLNGKARERAESCLSSAGLLIEGKVDYVIKPNGLAGFETEIDLIVSRAVLEHVNDLSATFDDMYKVLAESGLAIHKVDLRSHALHRRNQLDFLTWPEALWRLMYSHKGAPNRLRVDFYRRLVNERGFKTELIEVTDRANIECIREVRPRLAKEFRNLSDDDLGWLGFWLVIRK